MGPGPSDVSPRVLAALAQPTIGHLDPEFIRLMDETKVLLQYAFQTKNQMTFPVSAPGSAGMECTLVNLLEPGDKSIVCVNGVFGGRMKEIVSRIGATPIVVEDAWGTPVDPQKVEDALKKNPGAKVLAWVQAETSTGAESDSATLAKLGRAQGCLLVTDTVTALGGTPLRVDEWGLDAVYSGTQKCLSCVPGLSPVTFSERALEAVKKRKTPVVSWFLDISLLMGYWSGENRRAYHHTAPINANYALHEALTILREEGLENAWARHRKHHLALRAGVEAMGLSFVVAEPHRLPQLNSISVPAGVDEAAVRRALLNDHGIEIGAGLGTMAGKIWRIGVMGHSAREENIVKCVGALETVLRQMGQKLEAGAAVAHVLAAYASRPRQAARA
jgi:alanine-glyoxylate transaminase/serine-glyoxylate transaminase/serine-pyruvate transaminase